MGLIRLAVCVLGVYGAFLLWAIAQERLSAPFPPATHEPHAQPAKFPSPLFFNWSQALASASASAAYLLLHAARDGSLKTRGVLAVLGLDRLFGAAEAPTANGKVAPKANGKANGHDAAAAPTPLLRTLPALLLQVALFQTTAGPIGFLALRHISYPTMVLGKSCKLIPVLLLNVLLYRRKFAPAKYLVVGLVSAGIALFMLFGKSGGKKGGGSNSAWGLTLLLINLIIDGLTNSTQDQIFTLYPGYSGQQMMFIMASITLAILTPAMVLPLPSHPLALLTFATREAHAAPSFAPPILLQSARFIASHPSALNPLLAYAALGGLGQIFIFETIAHFGSLTLVMVTVTRKLFTMLLSVIVFGHELTPGQWGGVAVVFAGIGVEAAFKWAEGKKKKKVA
ncbi:UDP-galactose transporter 1 [Vanrija pseudolonga]|uniref:UDP-galactose transporter homolog 1 n=1 Tax=Vanrija pseudolonga TaxID=143232 RepID=A0AAF1BLS4_9TREE|nr:UDP-galactose transporter 1 [Vanrija pseudolonga]